MAFSRLIQYVKPWFGFGGEHQEVKTCIDSSFLSEKLVARKFHLGLFCPCIIPCSIDEHKKRRLDSGAIRSDGHHR